MNPGVPVSAQRGGPIPSEVENLRAPPGFTLVEVIVAIGMVAVTVTSLIGLLAVAGRPGGELSERVRAVHLAGAVHAEMVRLRNLAPSGDPTLPLERLAAIIPSAGADSALRLVGSSDGLRAVRETDVDDKVLGLRPDDRHFVVEVRQHSGSLKYSPGNGSLAVTASVRWPYTQASGAGGSDGGDPASVTGGPVVLNLAVGP